MRDDAGGALGLWGSFKQCASPSILLGVDSVSPPSPLSTFISGDCLCLEFAAIPNSFTELKDSPPHFGPELSPGQENHKS